MIKKGTKYIAPYASTALEKQINKLLQNGVAGSSSKSLRCEDIVMDEEKALNCRKEMMNPSFKDHIRSNNKPTRVLGYHPSEKLSKSQMTAEIVMYELPVAFAVLDLFATETTVRVVFENISCLILKGQIVRVPNEKYATSFEKNIVYWAMQPPEDYPRQPLPIANAIAKCFISGQDESWDESKKLSKVDIALMMEANEVLTEVDVVDPVD